ncbi:uncharacterized protein LOC141702285 [Apium graveolens]|uniref:uncharacterized protein LOC141702285 n=1 Tax=Apium graveolens TaxID=4045 RepID=UPI003D79B875
MGWVIFCETPAAIPKSVVHEFYANAKAEKNGFIAVRGMPVDYSAKAIRRVIEQPERKEEQENWNEKNPEQFNLDLIVATLCVPETHWKFKKGTSEYTTFPASCMNRHLPGNQEEGVNKAITKGPPVISLCCIKGAVSLPVVPPTPLYMMDLYNDMTQGPAFHRLIHLYNAMFAFTSSGGNIDHSINSGREPYVENHFRWETGEDRNTVDAGVVQGLITMLDETNELDGNFRQQHDHYESDEIIDLEITLKVIKFESGWETNFSSTDEVAGIMVGDTDETCGERDIMVDDKIKGLLRVSYMHVKLMALQYPFLFPWGEDGCHMKIRFQNSDDSSSKVRGYISLKDHYSYSFQVRQHNGLTPRLGGRLFKQYLVDAFSSIKQTRLWWFRTHQTTIRNELYIHICDSVPRGDVDTSNTGKGIILPAGFVGSKRYMHQNFQDTLAVCQYVGHPDIFLTMTSNLLWDEIQKMIKFVPGCISPNCPNIVSRVFRLKLEQLMTDIKSKAYFGVCNGVMYVVEFQKRGLPHAHMLIWLDSAAKKNLKLNVDKYVSAEIPDPLLYSVGYAAVNEYCPRTTFDERGFPIYMRHKQKVIVQICHDLATMYVNKKKRCRRGEEEEQGEDEINAYFDGRYLCGAEAAYRIFGFPIHYRSISVERLPFHLLGRKFVLLCE